MSDSGSWNVLLGANPSPLVLSVYFPVAEHREAGFAELAMKVGSKYRFLQAKLPAARTGQQVSGTMYVDRWIDDIRDQPVMAVLGYRVGSVYAAAIAEGLAHWQSAPRVILFDPQLAGAEFLSREFRSEISAISSLLSEDEIAWAGRFATEIAESTPDDIANTAATVAEIYWEISSVAFERAGLGGAYCRKLFAPFESYISLVSAADQIDPSRAWKRSTAIVSSDYAGPRNQSPLAHDTNSMVGRRIPFSVPHAGLLRSDSVAKTVLDLLEHDRFVPQRSPAESLHASTG